MLVIPEENSQYWYPVIMPGGLLIKSHFLCSLSDTVQDGWILCLGSAHISCPLLHQWRSREPIFFYPYTQRWALGRATFLVSTLLRLRVVRSSGIGTSALILQDRNYNALRKAIDYDFLELGNSIVYLDSLLSSVGEVAQQNHHDLDLS